MLFFGKKKRRSSVQRSTTLSSYLHARLQNSLRRLRCEPLEDRRMLSITLFVDADAAGGDGLGWSTAYNDLQSALTRAAILNADPDTTNDVDSIWIAEGTYCPSVPIYSSFGSRTNSFSLVDDVTLYGGFDGTETNLGERDLLNHETILSGDIGIVDDIHDNSFFVVYCGKEIEAEIDGLFITDGNADESYYDAGGGIYNLGTLTVTNSTVSGNSAYDSGGGIFNYGKDNKATLTIVNSTISENSSGNYGGGIFNYGFYNDATLTIIDSTISGNSSLSGGAGIYNYAKNMNTTTVTITNSLFSDNSTSGQGGGIYSRNVGKVTLEIFDSTFSNNSASRGGAIYNYHELGMNPAVLEISNSAITGNSATYSGGGIFNHDGETIFKNVTVSDNTARDDGGGIYNTNSMRIADSTIMGNSSKSNGGGIYNSYGELTVTHSSFSGNSMYKEGGGICNEKGTVSVEYCVISENGIDYYTGASTGSGGGIYSSGTLMVTDSTITNNSAPFGAGIYNGKEFVSATVTLTNSIISDNHGGGIHNYKGSISINHTTVSGNSASQGSYGGGIYAYFGNVTIVDSTLAGNSSCYGGGIYSYENDITISNTAISANGGDGIVKKYGKLIISESLISNNVGAGMVIVSHAKVNVTDTTISGNSANSGGGICFGGGDLTLTNSVISNNSALYHGGGIYSEKGDLVITNSKFTANSADQKGGGIYLYDGEMIITNSTLLGNAADTGGGIYHDKRNLVFPKTTISNSIVAGNLASTSPDINQVGGTMSGMFNIIGNGTGQTGISPGYWNQVGTASLPIDPMLDEVGYPREGSPAIDAGNNDMIPEGVVTDIDGNYRIANGTVDIGAYEFNSTRLLAGDANCDGKVDGSDVTILAGNWQSSFNSGQIVTWAMGDFNKDGKVDGSDVTILAGNWQAGVSSTVVATPVTEPEPESIPTRPFVPPTDVTLGVATVAKPAAMPTRRFLLSSTLDSTPESTDAVFARQAWNESETTAIAKDLVAMSAKKSTVADEFFTSDLDSYAELD